MSIRAMQFVWERSNASGSALVVMLCLADHADESFIAWPSVATIARAARMQPRGVHKVLSKLVEAGEIAPAGTGQRGVVRYRLTCSTPVQADRGMDDAPLSTGTEVGGETPVQADICPDGHPCPGGPSTPVQADTPPLSTGTDNPLLEPSKNPQGVRQNGARMTAIPLEAFGIEAPPPPDPVRAMVDAWNGLADELGLARVQKLTEARRKKAKARLKDCGGLDGWGAALDKIRDARWMWDGSARNGWKADFDFLMQESRFVKLMEGAYAHGTGGTGQRSGAMSAAFDRLEAEIAGGMA